MAEKKRSYTLFLQERSNKIDFGQKINLVGTFKTLEKISDLDIVINKN
jgi:hypothetical protein